MTPRLLPHHDPTMVGSIDFGDGHQAAITPAAAIAIVRQLLAALDPTVASQLARELLESLAAAGAPLGQDERELLRDVPTPDRDHTGAARLFDEAREATDAAAVVSKPGS
ncbi:MAG: hypothetical protein EOO75_01840 [Myxococcales bacterium]|nr:MAG: hypothetical protein EOO75_01840 [Myxococcales bacterium]